MINEVKMVAVAKEAVQIKCRKMTFSGYIVETQRYNGIHDCLLVKYEGTLEIGECYEFRGEVHACWAEMTDEFNVFVDAKHVHKVKHWQLKFGCKLVLEGVLVRCSDTMIISGNRDIEVSLKQTWKDLTALPHFKVRCWHNDVDVAQNTEVGSVVRITGFLFSKQQNRENRTLPLIYLSANSFSVLQSGNADSRDQVLYALATKDEALVIDKLGLLPQTTERSTRITSKRMEAVKILTELGLLEAFQAIVCDTQVQDSVLVDTVKCLKQEQVVGDQEKTNFSEITLHAWMLVQSWNEVEELGLDRSFLDRVTVRLLNGIPKSNYSELKLTLVKDLAVDKKSLV